MAFMVLGLKVMGAGLPQGPAVTPQRSRQDSRAARLAEHAALGARRVLMARPA